MESADGKTRFSEWPIIGTIGIWGLLALQAAAVVVLLVHVGSELSREIGWRPADLSIVANTEYHNHSFELVVALALMVGLVCTLLVLRDLLSDQKRTDDMLRASSGSFVDLIDEYFSVWELTPAERDVALLAIKGFMIADIAKLRATKEGTIKAHCNAIYRKARVAGRAQLLSLFIEDLISHGLQDPEAKDRLVNESPASSE